MTIDGVGPLGSPCDDARMSTVSKEDFKSVMGSFAASVTVVTTVDAEGRKWGLTATAFSSLSLDPPLCLVCIDRRAGSHGAFAASQKFAVNMLTAEQEDLSNNFASRKDDKFEGIAHSAGEETGCPILEGALATMECKVTHVMPGGDHDIFVGELLSTSVAEGSPLLYFRGKYRGLAD